MKPIALISLSALALAGCGSGSSNNPTPPFPFPTPMPGISAWTIRYSPGMPTQPTATGSGFSFNFPTGRGCPAPRAGNDPTQPSFNVSACSHVDYVTRGPMPLNGSLTIDYTITGNNPVWGYTTAATNTGGAPPQLTLMVEHTNDQYLGNGLWRWDSNIRTPIGPGHFHVTVPLTFSSWAAVAGSSPGTQAQFQDVLSNLGAVGLVFGGGDSAGHGLYLTSGSATFILNSFTSP